MRRDIWQLHPVDVIVSADHMIETMLPVHCHKWHSIIIVKQKSAISVYGFLHFRCISVLDDCLKHLCHILCDWQYSCSGIRLCGFYDVSHIRCSLQLVSAIRTILSRQEYLGHTVLRKSVSTNFKLHKRKSTDEDEQYVFYNTHEPIISQELFKIRTIAATIFEGT